MDREKGNVSLTWEFSESNHEKESVLECHDSFETSWPVCSENTSVQPDVPSNRYWNDDSYNRKSKRGFELALEIEIVEKSLCTHV